MTIDEYITAPQAAEILGVTRQWIRALIPSRELPARLIGPKMLPDPAHRRGTTKTKESGADMSADQTDLLKAGWAELANQGRLCAVYSRRDDSDAPAIIIRPDVTVCHKCAMYAKPYVDALR
jgi:hypothetical protein